MYSLNIKASSNDLAEDVGMKSYCIYQSNWGVGIPHSLINCVKTRSTRVVRTRPTPGTITFFLPLVNLN